MSHLSSRQRAILTYLFSATQATTANQLAHRFGTSLRTIRYDLAEIRAALKGTGLALVAKPRLGLWLAGDQERRQAVSQLLGEGSTPIALAPQEREEALRLALLTEEKELTLRSLSHRLGCSRSTLLRDLARVAAWLATYDLCLERHQGRLWLAGPEAGRRQALVALLVDQLRPEQLASVVRGIDPPSTAQAIHYPWSDLSTIINQAEAQLGKRFTDESFVSLAVHMSVALSRLRAGQPIAMAADRLKELRLHREYHVASEMAVAMTQLANVTIPEAEIGFLTLHLLGGRTQALTAEAQPPKKPDQAAYLLADRFTRLSGHLLGVDLTSDELLRDGLAWHLQGLLYRKRYGLTVSNPMQAEVRQQMGPVFAVISEVVHQLAAVFGEQVAEAEIGFLTIHVAAALERQGNPVGVRVLVVCSTGQGSAQLLAARLQRVFKGLTVAGIVSALQSAEMERLKEVDLVISTIPLAPLPVPQVRVSPLLTAPEIERIRLALNLPQLAVAQPETAPLNQVEAILAVVSLYATIDDPAGLAKALAEQLALERPPLELIEPIVREVALLGIALSPEAQAGLAIHLHLALPRFRTGHYVDEPELAAYRQQHLSLYRAIDRGLKLLSRWHNVTIPEAEIVPIMRYILPPKQGS